MPYAEINGYRMHYSVYGDEMAPALVLIHGGLGGGDGSKDTINRQSAALSREYRSVFYDRRACGQSDAPEGGYDMPNCARDSGGFCWRTWGSRRLTSWVHRPEVPSRRSSRWISLTEPSR